GATTTLTWSAAGQLSVPRLEAGCQGRQGACQGGRRREERPCRRAGGRHRERCQCLRRRCKTGQGNRDATASETGTPTREGRNPRTLGRGGCQCAVMTWETLL